MKEDGNLEKEMERIDQLIDENLPRSIKGFQLRRASTDNYAVLTYSKDGNYLLKFMRPKEYDLEHYSKNVLYDVISDKLENAYLILKDKIDLNNRVLTDFPKYIRLAFNPSFEIKSGENKLPIKRFELYLVLDVNSDSQFFCAVITDPNDLNLLVPVVNEMKQRIKNKTLINLTGEDYNYFDFNLPKKIHIYNNDFGNNKDSIRQFFKTKGWNVAFKDKYHFKKQDQLDVDSRKIILCEGKNEEIFNDLKLPNILFSSEHNSYSIFQNVKTNEKYAIRDKDYLLRYEVSKLKMKFPKYYILDYYCVENYLYHPENVSDYIGNSFDKDTYIKDIVNQKDIFLDEIISEIKLIRKGYKELSENHINESSDSIKTLIKELRSVDFETFYQHFDMKKKYKRDILNPHNLNEKKLSKTEWFRDKINNIIK